MPADWQTPLVLLVVALAAGWLLRRALRRRRRAVDGCGGAEEGCGCSSLKKKPRR